MKGNLLRLQRGKDPFGKTKNNMRRQRTSGISINSSFAVKSLSSKEMEGGNFILHL